MKETKATNIEWHHGEVTPAQREQTYGHRGVVVWLTGLSGSGKSTVAARVERMLIERGCFAYVLDGDNIRHGLNRDLGFSQAERRENIRRIAEVAKLFVDAGAIVLTAFISPYREDRASARGTVGNERFLEVYVDAPIEVCEQRDPKGLYKKARAGEIPSFTGVSAPYEPPEEPDLVVHTERGDTDACAREVVTLLEKRGVFRK